MKVNQEFLHTPLTIPARKTADATNLKAKLRRDIISIDCIDAHCITRGNERNNERKKWKSRQNIDRKESFKNIHFALMSHSMLPKINSN